MIARRAAGSLRDSQSLLEQVLSFSDGHLTADQVHTILGTADDLRLHALATAMVDRDAALALVRIDEAVAAGIDAGRLAEQMLGYLRDLMAVSVGCDASLMRYAAASMRDELAAMGERWGLQTVLAVVGLIDETLVRIRHSVYARVLLEATVIQICHLPDLQAIADLTSAASAMPQKKNVLTPKPPLTLKPPLTPKPPPNIRVDQPQESAPAAHLPLSQVWPRALEEMDSMTATLARSARFDAPDAKSARLTFAAEASLAMNRCGTPQNLGEITATLTRLCGTKVNVSLIADAPVARAAVSAPSVKPRNRMQRMQEIESHPMVRACVEILGAKIVSIDTPRT